MKQELIGYQLVRELPYQGQERNPKRWRFWIIHISICFHWHMARPQLCIIIIIKKAFINHMCAAVV